MAEKRMIHRKLLDSLDYGTLTFRQQAAFVGVIVLADDQGRFSAHARWLDSKLFPYQQVGDEAIKEDLQEFVSRKMILLYQVEGRAYGQILNWWKYQKLQWAYPSDIPAPEGWTDKLRYRQDNKVIQDDDFFKYAGGFTPRELPEPDEPGQGDTPNDYANLGNDGTKPLPMALPKDTPKDLECSRSDSGSDSTAADARAREAMPDAILGELAAADFAFELFRQEYEQHFGAFPTNRLALARHWLDEHEGVVSRDFLANVFGSITARHTNPSWFQISKALTVAAVKTAIPAGSNGHENPRKAAHIETWEALTAWGITGGSRNSIIDLGRDAEYVRGCALQWYHEERDCGLRNPLGLLINHLRDGDVPTARYRALSRLTPHHWRELILCARVANDRRANPPLPALSAEARAAWDDWSRLYTTGSVEARASPDPDWTTHYALQLDGIPDALVWTALDDDPEAWLAERKRESEVA